MPDGGLADVGRHRLQAVEDVADQDRQRVEPEAEDHRLDPEAGDRHEQREQRERRDRVDRRRGAEHQGLQPSVTSGEQRQGEGEDQPEQDRRDHDPEVLRRRLGQVGGPGAEVLATDPVVADQTVLWRRGCTRWHHRQTVARRRRPAATPG